MALKIGQLIFLKDSEEYGWVVSQPVSDAVKVRKVGIARINKKEYEVKVENISVVRTKKLKDTKNLLKVGDFVITNADGGSTLSQRSRNCHWIYGKIGEIIENDIFIWNNTNSGNKGRKSIEKFKYSWSGEFNSSNAKIKILSAEIEYKIKCYKCDEELESDEIKIGADGEEYCENCFEENFHLCEACDKIISQDESFSGENGDDILCEDCYNDKYTHCASCEAELEIHSDFCYTHDGDSYCEDCYNDRFASCSNCGNSYHNDDLWFDEDNDEYLCCNCRQQKTSKDIHDYGYRPEAIFKKEKWDDDLFLGIELEVLHQEWQETSTKFIKFLDGIKLKDRFYLKHDGSLNDRGFEIVTHPETLQSIHRNIQLFKILKWLNKNDFDSDNEVCGLHIHINKAVLEDLDITKLRLFFKVNENNLMNFSKRDGESNFARFEKRDIKAIIHGENDTDRYNAINLNSSRETIEIRLFRGSLDYERVLSVLQFSDAIVRFVKKVGITCFLYGEGKYRGNSWLLFVDWCREQNRYKNLVKHLEKEKLVEVM